MEDGGGLLLENNDLLRNILKTLKDQTKGLTSSKGIRNLLQGAYNTWHSEILYLRDSIQL